MSGTQRLALLAATAVALVAASVLSLRTAPDDADRVRGYLGPTPGPARTAQGYVDAKRAHLARAARAEPQREAAALVSFASYQPAPAVQAMVQGMEATVVFVRFPASQAEPILVETTLSGAVADAASDLRKEIEQEIDVLEGRVGRAQGVEREEVTALLGERRTAYAKVNADCGCLYALAVEGAELGKLQELQARPQVRLVDVPDPLVNDLAGWELAPLVPPG